MKTVVNRFRYVVTNRLGVLQVQPLGESNFIIDWTREAGGKLDYKNELPSKIVFTGAAYQNLLKLERSVYRCDFVTITVERKCGSAWVPWFSGRMSNNDGTWDLDRCQVEIKLDDIKPEQCYEENKGTELNLLENIYVRRTVMLNPTNVTIEKVTYGTSGSGSDTDPVCANNSIWSGGGDPGSQGWVVYNQHFIKSYDGGGSYSCSTSTGWAREVMTVACGSGSPGTDWILIEDTCPGGSQKYARPAKLYNCVFTSPSYGSGYEETDWTCQIIGDSTTNVGIDNGLSLADITNLFVGNFCPGITFVSNFFQINPDIVSDINYVTGQRSKTRFITVYQKSDVKRPTVTGNATKALISWEKLFDALINMFNLRWRIVGNVLRMEHVSYFSKTAGFDLTQQRWAPYMVGKRKYTYQNEDIPAREEFKFMEAGYGDFKGAPITYSGGCVSQGSRDAIKTYSIDKVTTDVELCLGNPQPDSKVVSDDGFVFVAADFDGSQYFIISEPPILGGASLNNTLSWALLHRDYHKWDRPLSTGNMNYQNVTFFSTKPTKKGEKITIPLCCGDVFNPDDLIKTALGQGTVDKATFNFRDETLELDLLYAADQGLTQNTAPVAVNDAAITNQDVAILINVMGNDYDPDTGAVLKAPVIVLAPTHGTAVVQFNGQILYTPTTGYTGDDYFVYTIKDDWNQVSNNALVAITVRPPNTAPVANNDNYIGTKNTVLNIAAPGLFGNDADDVAFTLDAFDAASVHGGTVVVNTDGSFSYTPATGYVGIDTFTYRIKDTPGLTSTATVTIDVRDPNNPVANDDGIYVTRRNQSLSIGAPGVLANDTTGVGTLTATAGTIATANGGSVAMAADGSFTYFPASGFTGLDSFVYTADNGSGTDTATVYVRVLPDIYAKLQQVNRNDGFIWGECSQGPEYLGESNTAIYRVFFYANSAGSIPIDVTGLGVSVNYRITHGHLSGPPTTNDYTDGPVSGTQYDLFGGTAYEFYHNETDCFGNQVIYWNDSISLNPGYYTII
jgi:hypothetical protein